MDFGKIIACINSVKISENAKITQLAHEEDDSLYQVWLIETDEGKYILKEAKEKEKEIYQTLLADFKKGVPKLYQVISAEGKNYLLLEYIEGENCCKCNREKLILALDALIFLQRESWQGEFFETKDFLFEESVIRRKNRCEYLGDSLLEAAYDKFLSLYEKTPKALCHDDLLPFNIIAAKDKAVIIDWEVGGILPYPTPFARFIAHTQNEDDSLFYMSEEDKKFAIEYYYEKLLKEKGISFSDWINTLEYFLFYEYCEWVFVGNKYNAKEGEYFKKYHPIARRQAEKILKTDYT